MPPKRKSCQPAMTSKRSRTEPENGGEAGNSTEQLMREVCKEGGEVKIKVEKLEYGNMLRRKLMEDEEAEEAFATSSTPATSPSPFTPPTPFHILQTKRKKLPSTRSIAMNIGETEEVDVDENINVLNDAIEKAKDAARKVLMKKEKENFQMREEITKLKLEKETTSEKYWKYKTLAKERVGRIKELEDVIKDVKSKANMKETLLDEERQKNALLEAKKSTLETKLKEMTIKFSKKFNQGDEQGAIENLKTELEAVHNYESRSEAVKIKPNEAMSFRIFLQRTSHNSSTKSEDSKEDILENKVDGEKHLENKKQLNSDESLKENMFNVKSMKTDKDMLGIKMENLRNKIKGNNQKGKSVEKLHKNSVDSEQSNSTFKQITIAKEDKTKVKTPNEASAINTNVHRPKEVTAEEKSNLKTKPETKKPTNTSRKLPGLSMDSAKPDSVTSTPAKRKQQKRIPPGVGLKPIIEEPKVPGTPMTSCLSVRKTPGQDVVLQKTRTLRTRDVTRRQKSDIPQSEKETNGDPVEESAKELGESGSTVRYDEIIKRIQNQLMEIGKMKPIS